MALSVCAEPGCPELTKSTRCPTHEKRRRHQRIREGGRARGNTPAVIAATRRRYGNQCARCPATKGLKVHHRVRVADGGTDDPENLELLCHSCHEREHHG